MLSLTDLSTVEEVDDFIDYEICRYLPGFRTEVESRAWTAEERSKNPKLNAVLNALARRAELSPV